VRDSPGSESVAIGVNTTNFDPLKRVFTTIIDPPHQDL